MENKQCRQQGNTEAIVPSQRHCLWEGTMASVLIFCDLPTAAAEEELEVLDDDNSPEWEDEEVLDSWSSLVIDIDSD